MDPKPDDCYNCYGTFGSDQKARLFIYLPADGQYSIVTLYNVSDVSGNKVLLHLHAGPDLLLDAKSNKECFAIDLARAYNCPSAENLNLDKKIDIGVWHEEEMKPSDVRQFAKVAASKFKDVQARINCGNSLTFDEISTKPNGCGTGTMQRGTSEVCP